MRDARLNDDARSAWWRDSLDRDWVRLTLLFWAVVSIWFFTRDWSQVRWLSLGDTDDNMRLMQVRALLHGQPWYDLRQYRMNPPTGYDIHWSRLVDLPIAGLILFLRLFTSTSWAERIACGIAPLLPLSIAMLGLAATVRRLVSPYAWPLALVFLMGTSATMLMFMPERIDHHGWQLAMLSLTVAGLCDPKDARGGAIVGLASAVSLTIGLEMLPFSAGAGAIIALRWIWDRGEAKRLGTYALSLGGGSALGYAGFASYADRVMRCDALTPVWLSVMIAAGVLLFALAWFSPASRGLRLGLAIVAGALIVAGFVHFFPQCLGRPEQVSPELERNWLNNIREAKPITEHPFRVAFPIAFFPIIGLIGAGIAAWRARGDSADRAVGWAAVATFTRLCRRDAVLAGARRPGRAIARGAGHGRAYLDPGAAADGQRIDAGPGVRHGRGGRRDLGRLCRPDHRPAEGRSAERLYQARQLRVGQLRAHHDPERAQPLSRADGVQLHRSRPAADHDHAP